MMKHSKLARLIVRRAEILKEQVEPGDADELEVPEMIAADLREAGIMSLRDYRWVRKEVTAMWNDVNDSILPERGDDETNT
jgi:hypothetical protein